MTTLFAAARACLDSQSVDAKLESTRHAVSQWRARSIGLGTDAAPESMPMPGRPARPQLVHGSKVPRRGVNTPPGRAALVHAIAHIEFNAINLAWDAVYRFRDLPRAYYDDWVGVAEQEAQHFMLLHARLAELGHDYGDFPAHNGLWEMACKTEHDVLVRMALVPRVLEARGLDVTPSMIERLQSVGDQGTVSILRIILRDEIGHVAVGSRWFRYLCEQRGIDSDSTFHSLLQNYMAGRIKGPLHDSARLQAGFSVGEMAELRRQAGIERD